MVLKGQCSGGIAVNSLSLCWTTPRAVMASCDPGSGT